MGICRRAGSRSHLGGCLGVDAMREKVVDGKIRYRAEQVGLLRRRNVLIAQVLVHRHGADLVAGQIDIVDYEYWRDMQVSDLPSAWQAVD
jgi:hypothetical protein